MQRDVNQIIDNAKITPFLIHVIILGFLCSIIEGVELGMLGMIVPNMARDWGMQPQDFKFAHLAVLVGMLIGSIAAGLLTDKIGRRKSMLLMFGIATLGIGISFYLQNMTQLIAIRFITGLGAGGALPIAIAFAAEYSPKKYRNMLTVLVFAGASFATTVAGFIGPYFMEVWGWRGMFLMGFIMAFPVFIWLIFFLPHSVKYLVAKGEKPELARTLLQKVEPSINLASEDELLINEEPVKKSPIRALFSDGRGLITGLLWLAFISSQFMVFFMSLWLPTVLQKNGWEETLSLNGMGVYYLGGGIGSLIIGWLADKFGAAKVLVVAFPVGAFLYFLMGQVVNDPTMWFIVAPITGAVAIGAMMAKASFAASIYPTSIRGTGIGTAMGIGRIGALLTPGIGAAIIAANISATNFHNIATIAPLVCAFSILMIILVNKKKTKQA